jgi:hypothetical protein
VCAKEEVAEMTVYEVRRNRLGAHAYVEDNRDEQFEDMGEGFTAAETRELRQSARWATVCHTHGTYVLVTTRAHAVYLAAHTDEFCGECQEASDGS